MQASTEPGARFTRLRVTNLRNIEAAELQPSAGVNLILGPNGAGKTSVLEGIHLLSHGRSFRGGRIEAMIGNGAEGVTIYGELIGADNREHRAAIERGAGARRLRLDGAELAQVAGLAAVLPVLVFEPHAHELVEGGPEKRRQLLDWGVFHVEHDFLHHWRRYQRALRQRNAALRQGRRAQARQWVAGLAEHGVVLDAMRQRYAARLASRGLETVTRLSAPLADLNAHYRRGWPAQMSLGSALEASEEQDMRLGYTGCGPHRADLRLLLRDHLAARRLSRGQEKLVALALLLAQGFLFAEDTGRSPILLLDDLSSELDAEHLERALGVVTEKRPQIFITALQDPRFLEALEVPVQRFHVEQGRVTSVV